MNENENNKKKSRYERQKEIALQLSVGIPITDIADKLKIAEAVVRRISTEEITLQLKKEYVDAAVQKAMMDTLCGDNANAKARIACAIMKAHAPKEDKTKQGPPMTGKIEFNPIGTRFNLAEQNNKENNGISTDSTKA